MGVIAVADTLMGGDSPRAIRELQNMGIRVVMLTGDNHRHRRCHWPAGRRGRSSQAFCPTAGGRDPQAAGERQGGHGGRRHPLKTMPPP